MKKDIKRDIRKNPNKDNNKINSTNIKDDIKNNVKKDIERSNLANTLDHYDEAMTINAVGRLLDKSNKSYSGSAANEKPRRSAFAEHPKEDTEEDEDHRGSLYNHKSDYGDTAKINTLKASQQQAKQRESYEPVYRKKSDHVQEQTSSYSPNKASARRGTKVNNYDKIAVTEMDDDELEDEGVPVSGLRVVVFSVFLVFLGTLVFLVLRINTVTRQLEDMQTSVVAGQPSPDIEALIGQRDELEQQVLALESMVFSLQQQVQGVDILDDTGLAVSVNDTDNATSAAAQTEGPITHVVQQGQSLSSISNMFYGTSQAYSRIMEANNLQTTELQIGQVLIIPE